MRRLKQLCGLDGQLRQVLPTPEGATIMLVDNWQAGRQTHAALLEQRDSSLLVGSDMARRSSESIESAGWARVEAMAVNERVFAYQGGPCQAAPVARDGPCRTDRYVRAGREAHHDCRSRGRGAQHYKPAGETAVFHSSF